MAERSAIASMVDRVTGRRATVYTPPEDCVPQDLDKPVRQVLHRHREQRSPGHSGTTGCACGWCPKERKKEDDPSLLQQYLQHVAEQLRDVR